MDPQHPAVAAELQALRLFALEIAEDSQVSLHFAVDFQALFRFAEDFQVLIQFVEYFQAWPDIAED